MSNNSIVEKMSLHILLKSLLNSISSKQDSLKQFGEIMVNLEIAEKNELCIVFKDASNHFILNCDSSTNKRSNNFIDSIDDKTTKKRTDSDKIREILFTHFSTNNFQSVQKLAKFLSETTESNKSKKRKYKISNKTFEVLEEFCRCPFNNEDNNQELRNFLSTIDDYYTRLAWTFVFLCFPQTPSEKNTDYRLLLLNKILQSGHTESKFQPLDITGNDQQIEKINSENIGRSEELEEIKKEMLANNTVLVYGIGGIGKSYICRKLFWNYYDSFSDGIEYLAWIQYNGDLIQSVTSSFYDSETNLDNIRKKYEGYPIIGDMFVKLALADKPDDKMEVIKEYFSKLDSKLLVFIDNADTMTKEEKKWLNSCKCRMIITSRQKIDGFYGVNINSPSPAYCKEMYILESRGNNWDGYSLDEEKYINKITELANYHTQTVMLIAKAQYCLGLSSKEMLEELNATGFVLQGYDDIIDTEDYELTMAEHLTKIFNLLNVTDETQLKTIRLFSLLAPNTPIKKRDIKKWFELKSLSSINELVKYGWLNSSGSEYVSIHPVIADVVKYNNKPDFEFALPLINALQNEMKAADNYIKKNAVIIHAVAVAEAYRTINKNEFAEFLGFVSNTYDDMTLYELAIKYNMYSLKILEESNQNNTTLYASICNNLASIYFDLDRYNDSLNYYNLAINIYEHTEIYHAANIATSYNGIARTYRNIKDYKNAISFHKKVLIIAEEILGLESYEAACSYNGLASIYCDFKLYDKALEYYNKALSIKEEVYGFMHIRTAITYSDMAIVYNEIKKYDLALECYKKAIGIYESIYGTNHSYTAIVYHNIANVYYEINENDIALSYFKKSLIILEEKLGEKHSFTISTYVSIAKIYDKQYNTNEAFLYYNKALELLKKHGDMDDIIICKRIGNLHYYMKNYSSALEFYYHVLDLLTNRVNENELELAMLYNNIATCYLSLNQYEKSIDYFFKSEQIFLGILGEKHIELSSTYHNIATNYKKMNDFNRAIDYYNKALGIEKEFLGGDHPDTLETQKKIDEIQKLLLEQD